MEAESIIIGILLICCLVLYVSAIINIHQRKFTTYSEKARWLTFVIVMPVIGSLLYFFVRPQRPSRPYS